MNEKFLMIMRTLVFFTACGKSNNRMKEVAAIESESSAISQLKIENGNLATKSEAMEIDLARRHRFYQAVKGSYEGTISTVNGDFSVRVTLTPNLAPIKVDRVRQLEEIASDLNTLALNAQIIQWDPKNVNTAIGCRVSGVRADIESGEISIASESCANLYIIRITERGSFSTQSENVATSRRLANQLVEGDLSEVDSITGQIQPSTNATIFRFVALKVK